MRFIFGEINGEFLRDVILQAGGKTEYVLAAVAYANNNNLLFDWCLEKKIPLKFWGRLDSTVAVSTPVLEKFLKQKSPDYICKLVQHHHAKIIWWRGVGLYIGSANLTDKAWYKNIEGGCFFEESEIDDAMASEIMLVFDKLEEHATPLTDELFKEMLSREASIRQSKPDDYRFWNTPSFHTWGGLGYAQRGVAKDRSRQFFLDEWHSTLQGLRDIAKIVSTNENRPSWIDETVPAGSQADQFLHAHYYLNTFDGRAANYEHHYSVNKSNPKKALEKSIDWWKRQDSAPANEDKMLYYNAPILKRHLSSENILGLSFDDFKEVCENTHAVRDYARRVANKAVSLPENGTQYSIPEKVDALSKRMWEDRSNNGSNVKQVLWHVLYDGNTDQLPNRLWDVVTQEDWKFPGLGISTLGEIVGWALPDLFPPRNGRTSKALRSLGFNVKVHVG